jgi:cardiolipin synthase
MTAGARPAIAVVDRALDRVTGSRAIPGNAVRLLTDGPQIYEAALAAIAGARSWIHFDNYIIRDDRTGWRFLEALVGRAAAGVRVRVLSDWLGSLGTSRRFWESLRQQGVEVRVFGPPRVLDLAANLVRNHRKLIVVDGVIALTGGFCIADEWAGDPERGRLPWRETGIEIRGPAAAALDLAFARVWAAAGDGPLPADELAADTPAAGSSVVRVIAGEPGRDRLYRTMDLLLSSSTQRFWVTDAYFVAPRRLHQSLLDAARDGVDVRLLVPHSSDLPWIRNLTRIGYRSLLRGGVRIYEWEGPILHAKSAVADGRWTRIGSSNLNPSSLLGNWELDVLVDDPALAAQLEERFRRDVDRSAEVSRRLILVPKPLAPVAPTALTITRTGQMPIPEHRRGLRERGRRTLVSLYQVAAAARLATFGPLSVLFLLGAALFVLLPGPMAILFAVLFVWVGAATAVHAVRSADRG